MQVLITAKVWKYKQADRFLSLAWGYSRFCWFMDIVKNTRAAWKRQKLIATKNIIRFCDFLHRHKCSLWFSLLPRHFSLDSLPNYCIYTGTNLTLLKGSDTQDLLQFWNLKYTSVFLCTNKCSMTWRRKKMFPCQAKDLFLRGNSGEISFYKLETKRKIFFTKNLSEKYQIF